MVRFPIDDKLLIRIVRESLNDVHETFYGEYGMKNGVDFFLTGQAIGNLFEAFLCKRLCMCQPGTWRGGTGKFEKDIEHRFRKEWSFEIKTSSSKNAIVGNRSSASPGKRAKKKRDGYLLAINYKRATPNSPDMYITHVRLGKLRDSDWKAQRAKTGQAARVSKHIIRKKMRSLYKYRVNT